MTYTVLKFWFEPDMTYIRECETELEIIEYAKEYSPDEVIIALGTMEHILDTVIKNNGLD